MAWRRPGLSIGTLNQMPSTLKDQVEWKEMYNTLDTEDVTIDTLIEVLENIQSYGSAIERDSETSTAKALLYTLLRWRNNTRLNKPINIFNQVKSATQGILLTYFKQNGGRLHKLRASKTKCRRSSPRVNKKSCKKTCKNRR